MKEPVFAVRPEGAFGLYEKHFQESPRAGNSSKQTNTSY